MSEHLRKRIYGALAGVAVGDALGYPAHELTSEEIRRRFDGPLDRMAAPFDDDFIHMGFKAGQITDDTILTLVTARAILHTRGGLTADGMARTLAEWAAENETLWKGGNVFGPSTQKAFINFIESDMPWKINRQRDWCHSGTSNGAVMRVSPAGLVHPGRIEEAVHLAYESIAPTHGTQVAISAAGAQAAAVANALTREADVMSVVEAALEGARRGEQIGREKARVVPSPSIPVRIEWAVECALKAADPFDAGERIQEMLGTHLAAAEALPAALGLFVASQGDPRETMVAAATTGGDTDTIASIGGALCGALQGVEAIPANWLEKVEEVNTLGLRDLTEEILELALQLS